ncbi:regulator of chromosome condensation, putative [Plasmodium gallinaceum]|uniref:Regulator of chromosome condensation, putative n=1 Tax=Plasmodium gallinaceum TaxID=5849 RepID=A0A1J1GLH6_PLAGA|nr:regulator of chromosome condensation, putative [Plasmodium gallinaceum]CRG93217.1 regulator of chromosome condensation, putative [Plasmodium gallinaceum]
MSKLYNFKKKSEANIKTCYELNSEDTNYNDDNNIINIRRKNFSHNNILEQLATLSKKKKTSTEENDVWDIISNISNYSSDNNKETEKKKILICLGNNNFGQLGSEENDWIGFVDFSSILINRNKSDSHDEKYKKCKKFNDITKDIKKRRNSMYNNYLCNNLGNNEIYNKILTSLPNDFHLSTIERNIKKNKIRNYKDYNNDNKASIYNSDSINNKISDINNYSNNYYSLNDNNKNTVENLNKIKLQKDNKEIANIKLNYSSNNKNDLIISNIMTRNKYKENLFKKQKNFSENENNYKKYKEKLKEYDDFLSVNEEETTNSSNKKDFKNEEKIFFIPNKIKCGKYHSAVVSENGFVCLWGLNYYGQLGIDSKNSIYTCYKKTKFRTFKNKKNKKCCPLIEKEKIILSPYIHKLIPLKQFGYKHKVKNISLGAFHTLILSYDGYVFTFGCNKKSQLGLPNYYDKKISYTSKPFLIPVNNNSDKFFKSYNDKKKNRFILSSNKTYSKISHPIIYITCGSYNSGIIDANKKLWLWGWNKFGQIDTSYINEKIKKKEKKEKKKKYEICTNNDNIINLQKRKNLKKSESYENKKRERKKEKINNKNVNIPRNINIKKKKMVQISMGKYHSLCLTEDKCVYVWGYLNKNENEKHCFNSSNDYYKNVTALTKIKCLSNLHISNIVSSSTHTAFVAPIKYVNEQNFFMKLNKNWYKSNINKRPGDLFRYNILSKNEGNNNTFLKYYPYNYLNRGGDNVYYVKYTDLHHLINFKEYVNEVDNICNKYSIMNDDIYGNHKNNILRNNMFDQHLEKYSKNFKIENILKPLFLTHSNEYPEINSLQIFQIGIGKNFGIFLTSSPSINKILNNKKIDYINNICSLGVLRNKIPERNIFVIGKSNYNQLCLPSNSKHTISPVYLDKNKLIDEVLKRNKKYNFLNVSNKKKYSDQISYNNRLFYLKKYEERIKKSVTNCSLLYNDVHQKKFSLISNKKNSNKNSLPSYKLNESNLSVFTNNKKSISCTNSSEERDSNNNLNITKNMENENQKVEKNDLEKYYRQNLKSNHITSTIDDQDKFINDDYKQNDTHIFFSSNFFNEKNSINSSNSHVLPLCDNLNENLNTKLESEDITSFIFHCDNIEKNKKEKSFHLIKNEGFVNLLNQKVNINSEKSNEKEINPDFEINETNHNPFEEFYEYSSHNILSTNMNLNISDKENEKNGEHISLNPYNIVVNNNICNIINKNLTNFEIKDDKKCSILTRKKRSSSVNKKDLFRNMILEAIDNINNNTFDDKNEKIKLTSCEKAKSKFKVFKKRNSCLWNFFTYNETKKKNSLNYNLSEKIVNVTLLDVACGDYHSLILLEVDTLTK